MISFKRIINHILQKIQYFTIPTSGKTIFLTFDDGPEPDITEFVLDELRKYGFKATFFCRGDNAEKNPKLLERIINDGHSVGNHTYSHLHSFKCPTRAYCEDVEKANCVLKTNLFRPPHGSHTLFTFLRLRKKYKSFFWSLNSGDSDMDRYDFNRSINSLKSRTKPGDIVLFHFCHKHEKETRELLPVYLKWLADNGYKSDKLS